MLLEVPYVYTRRGYYPRERTPGSESLTAMTIVRVRDIDAAQAPLVASSTSTGYVMGISGDGRARWTQGTVHTDYRQVDGQLVRRLGMDVLSVGGPDNYPVEMPDTAMTPGQLARIVANPGTVGEADAQLAMNIMRDSMPQGAADLAVPPLGICIQRSRPSPRLEPMIHRVESEDKEACARAMRAHLQSGLYMIDGALYVPSQGPAWVADSVLARHRCLRIAPELSRIAINEVALCHMPHDPLLEHDTELAAMPREGSITTYAQAWAHPDDANARAITDLLLSSKGRLASELAQLGSSDGLRCMAALMDALHAGGPPSQSLGEPLCRMADIMLGLRGPDGNRAHVHRADAAQAFQSRVQARARLAVPVPQIGPRGP